MDDIYKQGLIPTLADGAMSRLLEKVTPVSLICGAHTCANILKMCFENEKGAKNNVICFRDDFEGIKTFLRKASVKSSRQNDRCHRCFNDVLWEENQKENEENNYRMLHRVHDVRFTSLADEIKSLLQAKPIIQNHQMNKGPQFELVKGNLYFQNLYPVFLIKIVIPIFFKIFIPFFVQNFHPVFSKF